MQPRCRRAGPPRPTAGATARSVRGRGSAPLHAEEAYQRGWILRSERQIGLPATILIAAFQHGRPTPPACRAVDRSASELPRGWSLLPSPGFRRVLPGSSRFNFARPHSDRGGCRQPSGPQRSKIVTTHSTRGRQANHQMIGPSTRDEGIDRRARKGAVPKMYR